MSSTTTAPHPHPGIARATAAGALLFVALLVTQNIIRASEPGFAASTQAVSSYFAKHRTAVQVPLCLFPIGMLCLLTFVAGLRSWADGARDRFWADLGTLAALLVAALFAIVNIAEVAIAVIVRDAAAPQAVSALWAVHAGAFGFNLAAIAVALVALSHLARQQHLVPGWIAMLALLGGACLFATSVSTLSIAKGGPMLYIGLLGFFVWGVFLVVCALGLLRSHGRSPVDDVGPGRPPSMNTVIHAAFRRDLARFDNALASFPDRSQKRADDLHRAWRHYAKRLHQHHRGEEEVFFPALARVEDVAALMADLETEHAAMSEALTRADRSMDELQTKPTGERAAAARAALLHFGSVLLRHLEHEERDYEPLANRHSRSPDMREAKRTLRQRHRKDGGAFFTWLLDGATSAEAAALRHLVPRPALKAMTVLGGRSYRNTIAAVWR